VTGAPGKNPGSGILATLRSGPALPGLIGSPSALCAIVAVRNEERYLPMLLEHLKANEVDIVAIDNGSTDQGRDILARHLTGRHDAIHDLPYEGVFSLKTSLECKERIVSGLPHRWILHCDADEIHQHPEPGRSLADLAVSADKAGANTVNFEEFVCLPPPGEDYEEVDMRRDHLSYYFHQPSPLRLMRMWRRDAGLSNIENAGHRLNGTPRLHEAAGLLKHYIFRNQRHAWEKYRGRTFSDEELAAGWHSNRVGLTRDALDLSRIPEQSLDRLVSADDRAVSRDGPFKTHYWEW
jgi:glycosyltransferase involved in cell wall biosynthesis